MRKPFYLYLIIFVLFASTLACSSITNIGNQVNQAKETVQSVATQANQLVTEGAPLLETVQAVATENPNIVETVETVATDNPGALETAQAVATEGVNIGTAPADIPLVDKSTITNFFGMADLVSYTTNMDFQSVVSFYKSQMPTNGWSEDKSTTYEMSGTTSLGYTKDNKSAIVVITNDPTSNLILVVVTVTSK